MHSVSDNTLARVYILGAMFTIGVIDVFVASISEVMGLWQFLVLRAVTMIPLALVVGRPLGLGRVSVQDWPSVLVRSFLLASALTIYFGALGVMPLAQAFAGMYVSPIFVAFITVVFLKDYIGPIRIGAAVIGFVGILIVQELNILDLRMSMFAALMAGVLYACAALVTRRRCAAETPMTLIVIMLCFQGAWGIGGLVMIELINPADVAHWPAYLIRGWTWQMSEITAELTLQMIGSVVIAVLLTRAYQLGDTAEVAVLENTVFVFGPAFAFLWLGQGISLWQGVGIVVIILASATISIRTQKREA